LAQIKRHKLSKYCHWKIRNDSVFLDTIEGKIQKQAVYLTRKNSWDWHPTTDFWRHGHK